jgi:hypothetical protein
MKTNNQPRIQTIQAQSGCYGRFVLSLLVSVLVNGCAGKPWTAPVDVHETERVSQAFAEMQKRDAACFSCVDAKVILTLDTPGEDRSVSGSLMLMLPAAVKFVAPNPLGQPFYALVSNGLEFQAINTAQKLHTIGRISSLAAQYDIPSSLLSDNWSYWLIGRLQEKGALIETIRQDVSGRGVWVTTNYPGRASLAKSHLLIQPTTKQLLARILVDDQDKTIATIFYEQRAVQDGCAPAERITITDLPYGSSLRFEFTDILTDRTFSSADFRLKAPENYNTQELH